MAADDFTDRERLTIAAQQAGGIADQLRRCSGDGLDGDEILAACTAAEILSVRVLQIINSPKLKQYT